MQTKRKRTVFEYHSILYAVTVCLYDPECEHGWRYMYEQGLRYMCDLSDTYIIDAPNEHAAEEIAYAYMLQSYDPDPTIEYRIHYSTKQLAYMNGKFHEVIKIDNIGD